MKIISVVFIIFLMFATKLLAVTENECNKYEKYTSKYIDCKAKILKEATKKKSENLKKTAKEKTDKLKKKVNESGIKEKIINSKNKKTLKELFTKND